MYNCSSLNTFSCSAWLFCEESCVARYRHAHLSPDFTSQDFICFCTNPLPSLQDSQCLLPTLLRPLASRTMEIHTACQFRSSLYSRLLSVWTNMVVGVLLCSRLLSLCCLFSQQAEDDNVPPFMKEFQRKRANSQSTSCVQPQYT